MFKNTRALSNFLDDTIYNIISTVSSVVPRMFIEGVKYGKFVSRKINGQSPNLTRGLLGYSTGLLAGVAGGTILGGAKQLLDFVECEADVVYDSIQCVLGKETNVGDSFANSKLIYDLISSPVKNSHFLIKWPICLFAGIFSAVLSPATMVFTQLSKICYGLANFKDYKVDDFSESTYLRSGNKFETINNIAYAPFKAISGTIYNIIGSVKSIPSIMVEEAKIFYRKGDFSKKDSYGITKLAGILTGVLFGGYGLIRGAIDGALDTLEYQVVLVEELCERLGGKRKFATSLFKNTSYVGSFERFLDSFKDKKTFKEKVGAAIEYIETKEFRDEALWDWKKASLAPQKKTFSKFLKENPKSAGFTVGL
ncbi:MAG: hypothetical protein ACK4OM_01705 [Alphaproteobacteria bacterium]